MNEFEVGAELTGVYQSVINVLDLVCYIDHQTMNDYTRRILVSTLQDYIRLKRLETVSVFTEHKDEKQNILQMYDELETVVVSGYPLCFPDTWKACIPEIDTEHQRQYMFYVNRMIRILFRKRFPEYMKQFLEPAEK